MLSAAGPAQALPPFPLAPGDCQQWGFPGPVTLIQSTGEVLTFNSTGPTASGNVNLTWIQDSNNGTVAFTGKVAPDGNATGTRDPNNQVTWRSGGPMTCTQKAPKEGPTVSFDPIIAGIVAHVTDRSGVTSRCQYSADFYNRSFRLAANSTANLTIITPPLLRNWDVDITCDNGTSTHTTTFF